ncbi:MAG: hypothetical protein V4649_13320 [Bacteroidota bacterium]
MKQYKISREFLRTVNRKALIKSIPLLLLACALGIFISNANSPAGAGIMDTFPLFAAAAAILLPIGMYIGLKKSKALLESYTISFADNLVMREQANTPTVSIYFNEIEYIEKKNDGHFVLRGKDNRNIIVIPRHIEEYDEISQILEGIRHIQAEAKKPLLEQYPIIYIIAYLATMVGAFTVTNAILSVTFCMLFLGVSIWNLYALRSNNNIDRKTKRLAWLTLLPMASALGRIILVLSGYQQM